MEIVLPHNFVSFFTYIIYDQSCVIPGVSIKGFNLVLSWCNKKKMRHKYIYCMKDVTGVK